MNPIARMLLVAALIFSAVSAQAEKADRDKPVNLDADRILIDDAKKINTFEGNVQMAQGTLTIRCEKLVVTQDVDGYQSAVATGGPGGLAHFRQKRDGKEEYVEGEAERIVHDGKLDKTEFFQRAHVKSGQDEVRGQYISFDGKNENYLVSSGPAGAPAAKAHGANTRVRAVIQPKKKAEAASLPPSKPSPEPPSLKAVPEIANPRQE